MSLRPRYAGSGRLVLPGEVAIGGSPEAVELSGRHGPTDWDPFERESVLDVLLAESFARMHLERADQARIWILTHGALDTDGLFPTATADPARQPGRFGDRLADIVAARTLVRWHLETLVRISDDVPWSDDRLRFPALRHPEGGVLWLGGRDDGERRITAPMMAHARFEDQPEVAGREEARRWNIGPLSVADFVDDWWPRAHRTWGRLVAAGVPVLPVPAGAWARAWGAYDRVWGAAPREGDELAQVGHDRAGLLEVARRLLEPYVAKAAPTSIELAPATPPEGVTAAPFEVIEHRVWRSALVPMHLQLLEAYRQVVEGGPGAARCKECGEIILALDPRRTSFCNDRERFRWSQRERRKRLAVPPIRRGTPP